jgi:hypothetical protein
MRALGYGLLLLLIVLFVALYLGWFHVSVERNAQDSKMDVTLNVDKEKIKEDAAKAKEKTNEALDNVKEKVGDAGRSIKQKGKDLTGAETTVKGEVMRIDQGRVALMTEDQKQITIQTSASTKILREEKEIRLTEVRQGDYVVVVYQEVDGKMIAESISVQPKG